jgi:polysaccharide export outer membrane protein
MNAVATAGGFTYRANKGKVSIKRQDTNDWTTYRLDPATPVAPGDTIRIGERFF